ncbi:MAG: glycosyltransferase family 2 protein [Phycisphaeraceae bacterium]|nr:glycosyltransferase family 2 protein [Phycisphaeraceae bacterium]
MSQNASASSASPSAAGPELSIIVPALNEEDNVGPLVDEVRRAVLDAGIDAEMIVVDDGSTDQTLPRLRELQKQHPWLRLLHRDKARGQSSAMWAGIHAARGRFVAMLDADLQNDPFDLPAMIVPLRENAADLVQGDRSANRRDTFVRRVSSWVGRTARRQILGDSVRDTGCSSRMLRREFALQLPLQFKGMHRFIPIYCRMLGARIVEMQVHHRPRHAGTAKYGVLNRAFVGLIDCFAMRWMLKRHRCTDTVEVSGDSR